MEDYILVVTTYYPTKVGAFSLIAFGLASITFSSIDISTTPSIPADAQWKQNGVTAAGGTGQGNATNQLDSPDGLLLDGDQIVFITDVNNHRVIQWNIGDTNGQVVAGNHEAGNRMYQLYEPTDVLLDKETDSFIICDSQNQRVVRWSRRKGTTQGEVLIGNIRCWGLAMDDQRYLYVSDTLNDAVRRYRLGEKIGTLIAGGNGKGDGLHQFSQPSYLFIDQQQTVYVSDSNNHRVVKWNKDAEKGILVAGSGSQGTDMAQLAFPYGLFVDTLGTVYVADSGNDRVMRWPQGANQGTVIIGNNGRGDGPNQFNGIGALAFDRQGNLYVVDWKNHRVQCFVIQ
ncbi:unnamed protein product [Rotaria sordida]|uniref:Uncharacterized protein n=1 Tax=Rotaria sordida TaxID=392033 RepID=A0A814WS01_9BILA|nr:unnamed protein product [Rotaria sordida]